MIASPSYVERRGTPKAPAELVQHDCIFGPTEAPTFPWEFKQGANKISVKVDPRCSFASAEALIACAREGLGIAQASAFMCKKELVSGQLITLLPEFTLAPVDIHAVFPAGRMPSPKLRSFTEFLYGVLADAAQFHERR